MFGKSMEDIRKRIDYKFVCTGNKLLKLMAKPTFKVTTKHYA